MSLIIKALIFTCCVASGTWTFNCWIFDSWLVRPALPRGPGDCAVAWGWTGEGGVKYYIWHCLLPFFFPGTFCRRAALRPMWWRLVERSFKLRTLNIEPLRNYVMFTNGRLMCCTTVTALYSLSRLKMGSDPEIYIGWEDKKLQLILFYSVDSYLLLIKKTKSLCTAHRLVAI